MRLFYIKVLLHKLQQFNSKAKVLINKFSIYQIKTDRQTNIILQWNSNERPTCWIQTE